MVFLIKLVHSIILIYMLICLALLWQYGTTGLYRRWLPLALGSLVLEASVWLAHGGRCPLTDWAIALGDETGADLLSDWIMPQPTNVMPAYAGFFVLCLVLVGRREWTRLVQKRNRGELDATLAD